MCVRGESSTTALVRKSASSKFSKVLSFQVLLLQLYNNILKTIHAMTKSFVLFYSAHNGESTDMNCLAF